MHYTEAVLFDLDNTLVGTSKLEEARTTGNRVLLEQLLPKVKLFNKTLTVLQQISTLNIPMGIVTNSPGWYSTRLLEHFNLTPYFKVIITYDDVGPFGCKPNALGINTACERLGVQSNENVFYIGDHKSDIEASYAAGVIPLAPSWAKTKMSQMPACVVSTGEFVEQLRSPYNLRLLAEAAADKENLIAQQGKKFYFTPLNMSGEVVMPGREHLELVTFGRYFTNKSEITSTLRTNHKLSKDISQKDAKENQEQYSVPDYWIDLVEFILKRTGQFVYRGEDDFHVVTVIPSKPHKPQRLENLLLNIQNRRQLPYAFITDLFYFTEDAASLKTLGSAENRTIEIQRSLHFNSRYCDFIRGKRIIVLDDVMTTGATFSRARELLEGYGIDRFLGVAIAKTIHAIGPQKQCAQCSRPMRIIEGKYNVPFWGCSGYFENTNPCNNKEQIEIKDCPRCGKKLVKKSGTYGLFLSHDWNLHGRECSYTESIKE